MKVIYKDYANDVITEIQALNSGEYRRVVLENNEIKKIEEYDNSILEYVSYYISSSENELAIVTQLTTIVEVEVRIITPKETLGNYFVIRVRRYRKGILKAESRELLDSFNNFICAQGIDSNTGLPKGGSGTKFYYGTNPILDDKEVFTAHFDDNGNFLQIYMPDIDPWLKGRGYSALNISELEARFPGTPDLSYYLTNTFEP